MNTKIKSKYRKFWYVCFNPYAEIGKIQKRHKTLGSALMEADRLAHIENKKIHVLKLIGTMEYTNMGPQWHERKSQSLLSSIKDRVSSIIG